MAAAIGGGLPITEPTGNMIVDIGGGTTEVAVIALAGIVLLEVDPRRRRQDGRGDRPVHQAQVQPADRRAHRRDHQEGDRLARIRSRSRSPSRSRAATSSPACRRRCSSTPTRSARRCSEPVNAIVDAVRSVLERTPPELSADIVDKGIVLSGGGAQLKNLDVLLREETGLPVMVCENPQLAVVLGTGKVLDELVAAPGDRAPVAARVAADAATFKRRIVDWVATALLDPDPGPRAAREPARAARRRGSIARCCAITAPLQAGVSWVVEGVGGAVGRATSRSSTSRTRTASCAPRTRSCAASSPTMTRRAFDVDALEDLAVVKRTTPADTLGARVIGAPMSPQFRVLRLRIDRGDNEVQPGMPVITGTGPVGRIDKVFGDYADVTLISDPALVGRGRDPAHRRARHAHRARPRRLVRVHDRVARARRRSPERASQVGDEIVTSGLGASFPPGLVVGKVTKRRAATTACSRRSRSTPAVDVSRVRAVEVLLAPPPPPDPDAKQKTQRAAFGASRCVRTRAPSDDAHRRRSCSSRTCCACIVARDRGGCMPAALMRDAVPDDRRADRRVPRPHRAPRRRAGDRRRRSCSATSSISSRGTPPGLDALVLGADRLRRARARSSASSCAARR